jgi:hypothetical protein
MFLFVLAGVVLLASLSVVAPPMIKMFGSIHEAHLRMEAGQRYMDSLTPEMCRELAARSDALIASHGREPLDEMSLPPDLKALKILRVDVDVTEDGERRVCYEWMGGFDHTYLLVTKEKDGSFHFTGTYDDEHDEVELPRNGKPLNRLE